MTSAATHPELVALLRSICLTPGCDTARLVLADWLDEHDGGGEILRYGVANPDRYYCCEGDVSVGMMCGRENPCNCCWEQEQFGVPHIFTGEDGYRTNRGLVCEIATSLPTLVRHAKALFTTTPVERVIIKWRHPAAWRNGAGGVFDFMRYSNGVLTAEPVDWYLWYAFGEEDMNIVDFAS